MRNMTRDSVSQCQELIKSLNAQIKRLENHLCRSCADIEDAKPLKTIPGIANLRPAIIYPEVDDVLVVRFDSYLLKNLSDNFILCKRIVKRLFYWAEL